MKFRSLAQVNLGKKSHTFLNYRKINPLLKGVFGSIFAIFTNKMTKFGFQLDFLVADYKFWGPNIKKSQDFLLLVKKHPYTYREIQATRKAYWRQIIC